MAKRVSSPVLVGRDAEGVLARAPMVEALRPLASLLEREELERVLGGASAELARLVP